MKTISLVVILAVAAATSYYFGYANGVSQGATMARDPSPANSTGTSIGSGRKAETVPTLGSSKTERSSEEFRVLINTAENLPASRKRSQMLKAAYARWAAVDPAAALNDARGRAAGERHDMTAAVVSGWATIDPQAAWKWIGDNPSKPRLDGTVEFYTEAIRGMIDAGKGEIGTTLLDALPPGEPRGMLTSRFVALWGDEDPRKAVEWLQAQELKDSGASSQGLSALAAVMGRREVSEGLKWIDTLPPSMQRTAIGSMAREWIKTGELDSVVKWVSTMPDRPEFDGVLGQLGTSLVTVQPQTALTFLTAQHDARARDVTLEMGASMLTRSAPEEAIKWALAMSTPQGVEKNVTSVFNSWAKSNRPAARSFIENAAISDALKKKLLE